MGFAIWTFNWPTLVHKNAIISAPNCPIYKNSFFGVLRRRSSIKFSRGTNFRAIFSARKSRKLVPRENFYIYSNYFVPYFDFISVVFGRTDMYWILPFCIINFSYLNKNMTYIYFIKGYFTWNKCLTIWLWYTWQMYMYIL